MNNQVSRLVRKHLFVLLRFSNTTSSLDLKVTIIDENLTIARKKVQSIKDEEDKTEIKFEHIQYQSSTPIWG